MPRGSPFGTHQPVKCLDRVLVVFMGNQSLGACCRLICPNKSKACCQPSLFWAVGASHLDCRRAKQMRTWLWKVEKKKPQCCITTMVGCVCQVRMVQLCSVLCDCCHTSVALGHGCQHLSELSWGKFRFEKMAAVVLSMP